MQSGSATDPWATADKEEIFERAMRLARNVNCAHDGESSTAATIECLRTVPAWHLVSSEEWPTGICQFPFVPIIDGVFLAGSPEQTLDTQGDFKKTNILAGSNADEGYFFLFYYLPQLVRRGEDDVQVSDEELRQAVRKLFPRSSDAGRETIAVEYTSDRPTDNRDALDKIVGDYHFTCGVNRLARRYADDGHNVYKYHFTHRSSVTPWPSWSGSLHGDEIMFVFGEPLDPAKGYLHREVQLAKKMMNYWANFARTG